MGFVFNEFPDDRDHGQPYIEQTLGSLRPVPPYEVLEMIHGRQRGEVAAVDRREVREDDFATGTYEDFRSEVAERYPENVAGIVVVNLFGETEIL
jgi:hypothetical protein